MDHKKAIYIWDRLKLNKFVNDLYDQKSKQFIISICLNDLEYVKNNYTSFNDQNMRINMFIIAITHSNSVPLVDFLINEFHIDLYTNNANDDKKMLYMYIKRESLDGFLDKDNHSNKYYLHLACFYNSSLDVIHFLIKNKNMNPWIKIPCIKMLQNPCIEIEPQDSLNMILSCKNHFIDKKYISNIIKLIMNNNKLCDCLMLSCISNCNVQVIKYLNECMVNNNQGELYIDQAIQSNPNPMVAKYLIEKTNLDINVIGSKFKKYIKVRPIITENYHRFNQLLSRGITKFGMEINYSIDSINPLMIDLSNKKILNIDPMTMCYDNFVKYVDQLKITIPFYEQLTRDQVENKMTDREPILKDNVLFEYNDKIYRGDRKLVYESMDIFRDLDFELDLEPRDIPVFPLIPGLPDYIIKMYIESCYGNGHTFNIYNIAIDDLIPCLKFIDQYPTKELSIEKMEIQIIRYLNQCNGFDGREHYLRELGARYGLKHLYMYMSHKYHFDENI